MPKLSPRILKMNDGGSDGWDVFYRARDMVEQGVDVTELTIGEHDVRTDNSILAAMYASARGGHTGYAMVPGVQALREAIAARTQASTGVLTKAENVLVTPGGQAALYAAHVAACAPGATALFIDPYYATYPGTIRAAGAVAEPVPTEPQNGFLPQGQTVSTKAQQHHAQSLLINSPNNPTGAVYPRETLHQIAEVCASQDMWLISDEVYDGQVWDGRHISPRVLPNMVERTLVVGSMSKSFAMTGSRIGWIVGPKPTIDALIDLATATTYGVPGYIQDAALFAMTKNPGLEQRIAAPFQRRRAIAQRILEKQSLIQLHPIQGAMYAMLDISATGLSGETFANRLLDETHIAVMPGESFGRSAAGHLRVAMTVADDKFEQALETLVQFAHDVASVAQP